MPPEALESHVSGSDVHGPVPASCETQCTAKGKSMTYTVRRSCAYTMHDVAASCWIAVYSRRKCDMLGDFQLSALPNEDKSYIRLHRYKQCHDKNQEEQ